MKKVIVRLGNGLGNQLFTYAAAYSFAKKNNSKVKKVKAKRSLNLPLNQTMSLAKLKKL